MAAAAPIIGQIAINLAIGAASAVISEALRPKQELTNATTSRGISFKIELGEERAVSAIFGEHPTAGHLVYANQYGNHEQYLQLKIDIGHGEHKSLSSLYVDDKIMTLTGSNSDAKGKVAEEYKDADGNPTLWIKTYTGAPGQVADPELVSRSKPGSRWGNNHTSTGVAYHVITMKTDEDTFAARIPDFRFIWKGLKLYDWRKDSTQPGGSGSHRWADPTTWSFSNNLYVIRWNYRRGIFLNGIKVVGLGFPEIFNDLDYYTAAANLADETISDPDTGTDYARYEYAREIRDGDEPLSILREMDAAGCGGSFSRGGAEAPAPAQQLLPVMTLEDTHRLPDQPVLANKFGSVSAKHTFWHGNFLSADNDWLMAPYPARSSASLETIVGRREEPYHQPYESITERAQMRAEINLRRDLFPATRTETFGPRAIKLQPGDAVTRNCEWGAMVMEVQASQRLEGNMGAVLTLREWDNSIVPASGESFVTQPGVPGDDPDPSTRTLVVSTLIVNPYQRAGANGAQQPYARAEWSLITDPNVEQVMVRVWPTAGTETDDGEDYFAGARLTAALNFGALSSETSYDYKAIPIRSDGRTCTWTGIGSFTSGKDIASEVTPMSVEFAHLSDVVNAARQRFLKEARDTIEELRTLIAVASEQDLENYSDLSGFHNEVYSQTGGLAARWTVDVTAATGPGSLIVGRLETLEGGISGYATVSITDALSIRIDDVDGEITINQTALTLLEGTVGIESGVTLFSMDQNYTPSAGWVQAIALQVRNGTGGALKDAGLVLEANASIARMLMNGDQVVVSAGGSVAALFENGQTFIDIARIHNLDADNISAKSIDADDIMIDGTLITDLIAANAASKVAIASNTGSKDVSSGQGNVEVSSKAITAQGGTGNRVMVQFTAQLYATSNGSNNWGSFQAKLYKDGSAVSGATCIARPDDENQDGLVIINYVDQSPSASSVTWSVKIQYITSPGPGANISARNRFLILTNGKK